MGKKVELSGVNTSQLPVLSNKKMRKLFRKMQNGNDKVRNQIVSGNLKLVLSVIQRFTNRGENMDDLFQVGCIGLMKSIDNFDLSKNVKFSTYAVPMIIGEIRRYLRDNNPIRVSRSLRDTAYKAMQMKEQLKNRKSEEPTLKEVAEELDISRDFIKIAEMRGAKNGK
jgi:RNA polymerase sporulation-specific sigma factor